MFHLGVASFCCFFFDKVVILHKLKYVSGIVAHVWCYFCDVNQNNSRIMATINFQDEIYATLTQRGNVIATIKMSGINSVSAVLSKLRSLASGCVGMVTFKLRNCSQGWAQCRNIMLSSQTIFGREAVQLTLF